MIKVQSLVGSSLVMAEASYDSAFGVISKIQKTAEKAAIEAEKAEIKAQIEKFKFEAKQAKMARKREFYAGRAKKIAAFIASLD